jgi:hypothetical protein
VKDEKEELNKDIENLKEKESTRKLLRSNKNTVENYSSKVRQVENKISEIKDKIDIKGKTRIQDRDAKGICKNSATPSKGQT